MAARSLPLAGWRPSAVVALYSNMTMSPGPAARSTGFQLRRCRRRVSIMRSMSASDTEASMRVTSSVDTSMRPISGTTSKVAVYSISPPPAAGLVWIAGATAGRSFSWRTASWNERPISSFMASLRTCCP